MLVKLLLNISGQSEKSGMPSWAIWVVLVVVATGVGITVGLIYHARRRKENRPFLGGLNFRATGKAEGSVVLRTGGQTPTRVAKRTPADE